MRARRPVTAEQHAKAEERRARFAALAKQIGAMSDDERVAMAARMAGAVTVEGRALSVHNACLLACQRPDATMVGGFNQWQAHGRAVRKGEHGLMIWAPVRGRERGDESAMPEPGASPTDRQRFIMVTVFDVAQTDALPESAVA